MRIRPALYRDLPAIRALLAAEGLPTDDLDAHLATFLVGVHKGEIVATGALEPLGASCLLRSIVVSRDCRGRGWGRRMTRRLLDLAARLRMREVCLLTTSGESFFATLGFATVPRETAPPEVRGTRQFAALCPAAAAFMRLYVDNRSSQTLRGIESTARERRMKITVVPNGPLLIETKGEWTYTGVAGRTKNNDRVAFCRCGASANKPFCDGAHKTAGFSAGGGDCELTPK